VDLVGGAGSGAAGDILVVDADALLLTLSGVRGQDGAVLALAESIPLVLTSGQVRVDGNHVVASGKSLVLEAVAASALKLHVDMALSLLAWGAWRWSAAFAFVRVELVLVEWSLVVLLVVVDDTTDTRGPGLVAEGSFDRPRVVSWVEQNGNLGVGDVSPDLLADLRNGDVAKGRQLADVFDLAVILDLVLVSQPENKVELAGLDGDSLDSAWVPADADHVFSTRIKLTLRDGVLAEVGVDKLKTIKGLPGDDVSTGASVSTRGWGKTLFALAHDASTLGTLALGPLLVDLLEDSLALDVDFTAALGAADALGLG